jgi:hypothetical protein
MSSELLLHELQALEIELHHPGTRCLRHRLEQLLHPGFHEVGRSGRRYDRGTGVNFLLAQSVQPAVESSEFQLTLLAAGVALLTYRSCHHSADGTVVNHALRSSIWLRTDAGWQLRYHQGTPTTGD